MFAPLLYITTFEYSLNILSVRNQDKCKTIKKCNNVQNAVLRN